MVANPVHQGASSPKPDYVKLIEPEPMRRPPYTAYASGMHVGFGGGGGIMAMAREQSTQTRRSQSGFTLVEIAIVLVIIGLLLGGILKGQEMINQARIKNIMNDFNGITAAYYSYQDRYRAIPGDDAAAPTRWSLGAAGTSATAGSGTVEGAWNAASATPEPETRLFWWNLRSAGFISGPTGPPAQAAAQPANAFGGLIGAATGTGAATLSLSGLVICSSGIPDKVAIAVDAQLDDQNAGTGSMRAIIGGATTALAPLATPPLDYVETGSNRYLMCRGV
jgi:prepilin-type N-terminal cleavage/methylation domain-containing protein